MPTSTATNGHLTATQLAEQLGVSRQQISGWVRVGLPKDQGKFLPQQVADWLVQTGRAEAEAQAVSQAAPQLVHTHFEAAAPALGVSSRTLRAWARKPGFPGVPSSPGIPGHFPIDEIKAWREKTDRSVTGTHNKYQEELARIKMERAELALQRERDELIHIEEAERFYLRTNSYVITVLDQLPYRLEAMIPEDVEQEIRDVVRQTAEQVVDECRNLVAELLEGERDDSEFYYEEAAEVGGEAVEKSAADTAQ